MGVAAAGRDSPGRNSGLRHAVVHLVGHVHLQHPAPAGVSIARVTFRRVAAPPQGCGRGSSGGQVLTATITIEISTAAVS